MYTPGVYRGELRDIGVVDELADMQAIVGGWIEQVYMCNLIDGVTDTGLVLICNEEGRLAGLPHNRCGVVGAFIVSRVADHECVALTDADIKLVRGILDIGEQGAN